MSRPLERNPKSLRLLTRALAMAFLVAAPLLAVPALQAADETVIEAPAIKNTGAGFVLMVSLRRG